MPWTARTTWKVARSEFADQFLSGGGLLIALKLWTHRSLGEIQRWLVNFGIDSRGGVAMIAGLAIIPLFVGLGLAIDGGRGYSAKSKLQSAIDAAGLAAGRAIGVGDVNGDLDMFFDSNYPADFLGGRIDSLDTFVDESAGTITISATATIPTAFMRVVGYDEMSVTARTVVQRAVNGIELALVLDDTGSMQSGGKITALKAAAHELLDFIYGEAETVEDTWIGVVPYRGLVNVGSGQTSWLTGYDPADYDPGAWGGCVEARAASFDQDDTPPDEQALVAFLWPSGPSNDWPPIDPGTSGKGPNKGCPSAILPLTAEKSVVAARIDALDASGGGGTQTSVGLIWGWRLVSPRWRTLWGGSDPSNLPLDYNTERMKKAVVFLTDGLTNFSNSAYTAYGFLSEGRLGTTNKSAADAILNGHLAATCEAMKSNGIEVYTIMFQLSDPDLEDLYSNCASSSAHFFNSPTNESLQVAFRQIGGRLTELRLAE